jgi:hypothetical protein
MAGKGNKPPTAGKVPTRNKTGGYEPTGELKSPQEYRRLAEKCRELARKVSTEKERAELLARADTWDLLANRNANAAEGASENGRPASKARARE